MGMFDEVRVNYPLPDGHEPTELFQTKDLDSVLTTYTITEDGRLLDQSGVLVPFSGMLEFYHPTYYAHFHLGHLLAILTPDQQRRVGSILGRMGF